MANTAKEEFIQIGVTALRGPTGEFLPSVPLYIKATPEANAGEDAMLRDISGVFADKMRQYIKSGGLDCHKGGAKDGQTGEQ